MVDELLLARLAEAAPRHWKVLSKRQAAVDAIQVNSDHKMADIDSAAARLGISRRQFYRLLEDRKLDLGESNAFKARRARSASSLHERIISASHSELGPGAFVRDVKTRAKQTSNELGAVAPSSFLVRHRTRQPPKHVGIESRIGARATWLLDVCSLDLVLASPRSTEAASLLILVHVASGTVAGFQLQQGSTTSATLLALLGSAMPASEGAQGGEQLWLTKGLKEFTPAASNALRRRGIAVQDCPAHTVRTGEAALMIFGQRLGSLSLRPRPRKTAKCLPVVDACLAKSVVDFLIDQRNKEILAEDPDQSDTHQ